VNFPSGQSYARGEDDNEEKSDCYPRHAEGGPSIDKYTLEYVRKSRGAGQKSKERRDLRPPLGISCLHSHEPGRVLSPSDR
jgi:hypothetical protein